MSEEQAPSAVPGIAGVVIDSSNAPQLTDAEAVNCSSANEAFAGFDAETVLVALGGRLQWREAHPVPAADGYWCASQKVTEVSSYGMQWYEIWHEESTLSFIPRFASELGNDVKGPQCNTLGLAKAACERHYATGQWDR